MKLSEFVKAEYGKSISECTNEELYYALLTLTKKMASGKQHGNSKKKLYYISAEFLIGKLLSNNLINLGIYDEVTEKIFAKSKNLKMNLHLVMEDLDDWQHALLILLRL